MTADELLDLLDREFISPHPGDAFLLGSGDGCEPAEEVGAFFGVTDWRDLTASFLDVHYTAPGFFSEAGLRCFLPAYMAADVRDELMTADPAFHLVHGFHELVVDTTGSDGTPIHHRSGGGVLLGPRRYGAITWEDASRHRLSVFCREEAAAICAYLRWRAANDELGTDAPGIAAALEVFWEDRAATAPTRADLAQ